METSFARFVMMTMVPVTLLLLASQIESSMLSMFLAGLVLIATYMHMEILEYRVEKLHAELQQHRMTVATVLLTQNTEKINTFIQQLQEEPDEFGEEDLPTDEVEVV